MPITTPIVKALMCSLAAITLITTIACSCIDTSVQHDAIRKELISRVVATQAI